ncbi:MAG: hypothetical protein WBF97_06405, partial [Comamonas sp.]
MSKPSLTSLISSKQDRTEALERKKAIATRLLKGRKQPSQTSLPARRQYKKASTPPHETPLVEECRSLGFSIKRLESEVSVAVHEGVERLAAALVQASKTRVHTHILLWPGSLKYLALAHATATLSEWHAGNKRGLRTLIYPAKANFLQGLNHISADRKEIGSLASQQYEPPDGASNPLVTVSMREKDPFLTCLNSENL